MNNNNKVNNDSINNNDNKKHNLCSPSNQNPCHSIGRTVVQDPF